MAKRIYVGNLPFSASDADVRKMFGEYGEVTSVSLETDKEGNPTGFGFVEMDSGAKEAIQALHQTDMGGRSLNVNESRPKR